MATTITQTCAPDAQDTFPEALAAGGIGAGYGPESASVLAAFFADRAWFPEDVTREFVTAMQRLDAAMAAPWPAS